MKSDRYTELTREKKKKLNDVLDEVFGERPIVVIWEESDGVGLSVSAISTPVQTVGLIRLASKSFETQVLHGDLLK